MGPGVGPVGRLARNLAVPAFVAGIALAVAIVAWQGFDVLADALARAGFRLFVLVPYFAPSLVLAALAWRTLMPPAARPGMGPILVGNWIGFSVNWLLPVAHVGGDVARAVWLARRRGSGAIMGASALVDKTILAFVQALIGLVGVGLLLSVAEGASLAPAAAGFSVVLLGLLYVFYRLQTGGMFARLAAGGGWLVGGLPASLTGGAAALDEAVREIYAARRRVVAAVAWRFCSRIIITGEVWLIMFFMGHPITVADALLLETLTQTVRAAAFVMPGAFGVQEAGFIVIGAFVGVPADLALAVSLAKRVRELAIGLPALLYWQVSEGRLGPRRRR